MNMKELQAYWTDARQKYIPYDSIHTHSRKDESVLLQSRSVVSWEQEWDLIKKNKGELLGW